MRATKIQIAKPGVTEFVVEAEESEEVADELTRQVWDGLGHITKRCQVIVAREPDVGWRVTVKRPFHDRQPMDPHGVEMAACLARLDRRGRP